MFADRADAGRRLARRLIVSGIGRPGARSPTGTEAAARPAPAATSIAGAGLVRGDGDRGAGGGHGGDRERQGLQAVPVVLALPRGGVPVGAEVAAGIGGVLDVVPARKIGTPGLPELALGAIAAGGRPVWNADVVARFGLAPAQLAGPLTLARDELARRAARYGRGVPPVPVAGRTAIVVDDGLATGATARAALLAVRARGPGRLVLAVPVAAPETVAEIRAEGVADAVVVLATPPDFRAVGTWYEDFTQVDDETVLELLAAGRRQPAAAPGASPGA
jgi:putative phosphoribosyl transferase